MRALENAAELERFRGRGGGTDAERRAAGWLAAELATAGREVSVEPFWCRPNWALAHAWHVALAVAGSLVAVSSPRAGGGMLLAALVFVLLDVFTGYSPGRRLTPEHASQNVVALPQRTPEAHRLRVVIVANYDAGRAGLAFRDSLRRPFARLRNAARGNVPGWLGWMVVCIVWLLVISILRLQGHNSNGIGAVQLPPTVALVLMLALLLELASSGWSPAGGDNATGVGVALELARALDAAPPRHVDVELVLTGASDREGIGLRRYLRTRRRSIGRTNTAVLGIAACSGGSPCWWRSEGQLVGLRAAPRIRRLAAAAAQSAPETEATEHVDRAATPALAALLARIPALAIGAADPAGLAPRSHQQGDTVEQVPPRTVEQVVELGLLLVDAMDASLADQRRATAATPA